MTKANETETRWWGWGDIDKTYPVEDRPGYIPFFAEKLDIKVEQMRLPDPKLEDLELRDSRLSEKDLKALAGIVGEENVSTSKRDRVYHAIGKSYRDIICLLYTSPSPRD